MDYTTTEDAFKILAESKNEFHRPIFDGVVDLKRYGQSSIKILWVLKEPWEKLRNGARGGGWSVTRDLLRDGEFKNNKGTYPPMAYVSYAVENGFLDYSMIPRVASDSKVRDVLRTLAYINIKKFPGNTSSSPKEIQNYYTRYEAFLLNQVEEIAPDVIIFGGTHHNFCRALRLENLKSHSKGPGFVKQDGRLYIAAYHPNQRSIGKASYVNGIVNTIKIEQAG